MIWSWRVIVATVLLVLGTGLEVVAVLGTCVMRDVYDRLHYVGLAGYGALLISVGVVFRESFSLIGNKALLVGVTLVLTGSILTHTTMRSLLVRERGDWQAAGTPDRG